MERTATIYYTKLSISCCCEVGKTLHRAALARKRPSCLAAPAFANEEGNLHWRGPAALHPGWGRRKRKSSFTT